MTGTDSRVNRKLLLEYDQKKKLYDDFLVMILRFLGEFIKENSLGVFSFEGEVMSSQELETRLKAGLVASNIEDIKDFVEIEILTYFEDNVSDVANVLNAEFKILEESINQEKGLDPQRFGYQAPSYLIRMMDSRLEWIEYRCFTDCKAKVKISSLLQNTWEKIQNRLNFDESSVPYLQQRPTQRIVGLFELADRELNQLKNSLPKIKDQTKDIDLDIDLVDTFIAPSPVSAPKQEEPEKSKLEVPYEIPKAVKVAKKGGLEISPRNSLSDMEKAKPEMVLTSESVGKLILDDPDVRGVDRLISDGFSTRLKFDSLFLENLCEVANSFHIPSKNVLLKYITQQEQLIFKHTEELINKPAGDAPFTIPRGISILMAFHVLANDGEDREVVEKIAEIIQSINDAYL
ncbi:MAG: hypothetical protein HQL71_01130 [Magnetococcales bacterium]|nr:hypothetical protein [Magnetococcales bacterium]